MLFRSLWRETDHPLGHKDFAVPNTDIMIVVEGPWTVRWSKHETGERSETYVRVMHPVHGLIRGIINCLEVVDETR